MRTRFSSECCGNQGVRTLRLPPGMNSVVIIASGRVKMIGDMGMFPPFLRLASSPLDCLYIIPPYGIAGEGKSVTSARKSYKEEVKATYEERTPESFPRKTKVAFAHQAPGRAD